MCTFKVTSHLLSLGFSKLLKILAFWYLSVTFFYLISNWLLILNNAPQKFCCIICLMPPKARHHDGKTERQPTQTSNNQQLTLTSYNQESTTTSKTPTTDNLKQTPVPSNTIDSQNRWNWHPTTYRQLKQKKKYSRSGWKQKLLSPGENR